MKQIIKYLRQFKQWILFVVISRYITIIKINRDHSNGNGFFIVNVPEAKQYGIGFTLYIKGTLYGFSVHNNGL